MQQPQHGVGALPAHQTVTVNRDDRLLQQQVQLFAKAERERVKKARQGADKQQKQKERAAKVMRAPARSVSSLLALVPPLRLNRASRSSTGSCIGRLRPRRTATPSD